MGPDVYARVIRCVICVCVRLRFFVRFRFMIFLRQAKTKEITLNEAETGRSAPKK